MHYRSARRDVAEQRSQKRNTAVILEEGIVSSTWSSRLEVLNHWLESLVKVVKAFSKQEGLDVVPLSHDDLILP